MNISVDQMISLVSDNVCLFFRLEQRNLLDLRQGFCLHHQKARQYTLFMRFIWQASVKEIPAFTSHDSDDFA